MCLLSAFVRHLGIRFFRGGEDRVLPVPYPRTCPCSPARALTCSSHLAASARSVEPPCGLAISLLLKMTTQNTVSTCALHMWRPCLIWKLEVVVVPPGKSGNCWIKDTLQFQAGYEVLLGSAWVEKVLGKGIICVLFQTRYSPQMSFCVVHLGSIM